MAGGLFGGTTDPSLLAPGTSEIAPEYYDLQMRQQLLAMLLAQSMGNKGTQMAGNVAIRQSPFTSVGNALAGVMAAKGLSGMGQEQLALAQKQAERAGTAAGSLLQLAQGTPGTAATLQEQPGPPNPETGVGSWSVQPGTPGRGPSAAEFASALEKARYQGVSPTMLAAAMQQFQRNQALQNIPDPFVQSMLPWNAGGGGTPSFTPATPTLGAQIKLPAGYDVGSALGAAAGGGATNAAPGAAAAPGGLPAPAGGPGGAPAAGGGGFYGIPPIAIAAALQSGDPAGAIAKLVEERTKPQDVRAGSVLGSVNREGQFVPSYQVPTLNQGQIITPSGAIATAPGYLKSFAEITDTQEAIKAGYNVQTTKLADGRTVPYVVGPGGAIRILQPAGAPTAPGAAPTPAPTGPPAQGAAGGYSTLLPSTNPRVNPVKGGPGSVAEAAYNAYDKAGLVKPAAGAAAPPPIAVATQLPGSPLQIGQSTKSEEEAKTQGQMLGKQQETIHADASKATSDRPRFQQMLSALDNFTPSSLAEYRLHAAKFATSILGYGPEKAKAIAGGDPSAMETFHADAIKLAAEATRATDASPAAIQVIMMQQSNPNLSMTKAGSRNLLLYMDGMAKWRLAKQQFLKEYRAAHGGSWDGGEELWNQGAPPDAFLPPLQTFQDNFRQAQAEAGVLPAPAAAAPKAGSAVDAAVKRWGG